MDVTGNRKLLLADRAEHLITSHRAVYSFHDISSVSDCYWSPLFGIFVFMALCFLSVEALLNFICLNFILISTRDESFEIPVAFDNSTPALHLLPDW